MVIKVYQSYYKIIVAIVLTSQASKSREQKHIWKIGKLKTHTTISLPLFSGFLASSSAATVLAPDDIPTCKMKWT